MSGNADPSNPTYMLTQHEVDVAVAGGEPALQLVKQKEKDRRYAVVQWTEQKKVVEELEPRANELERTAQQLLAQGADLIERVDKLTERHEAAITLLRKIYDEGATDNNYRLIRKFLDG